jgi:hypothetical protein
LSGVATSASSSDRSVASSIRARLYRIRAPLIDDRAADDAPRCARSAVSPRARPPASSRGNTHAVRLPRGLCAPTIVLMIR